MCGFVGVVNLDGSPVDREMLVRMRDTMVYRGPDDAGIYTEGVVGLAHRRLSIVDLSPAGHQPMTNEDSTLWLVFNGEIYNFVELASQLRRRGHRFRSDTDSEVILHLYEEHGEHCVKHLNGMFAFVIWDSRKRRLFGARDRTGIKPFHFCRRDDRFICASEIKAILEGEGTARIPDHEYFADYLYAGYSLGGKTPFRGIRQLLPGHCFTLQDGRFLTRKYWDVVHDYDHSRSDQQVIRELRELLDDSVRIHCRSDAPVGCHLSGGLDSSTVTAYAVRHRTPLKTFTIRFDGGKHFDESAYARAMAQHAGTEYIEATPDATELNRLLPALIWHLEAPMPTDGGFAYYTASHLAAQHVKVSLTGHGGDEIFAGYPAQFRAAFGTTRMFEGGDRPIQIDPPRLQRLRALFRAEGVSGIVHRIARRFAPAGDTLDDLWIALHCGATPRHNPLLHRQFVRSLAGYTSRDDYLLPLREASTDQVLDRCLYHDLRSYLPGLLHMEDRVSMAMSLESRVPLLDHRIIEFMATVPPEQKLRGHEPKALLRTAVGELLADEVRYRKTKTNFPVPVRSWLSGELAPVVRRIVLSPACLDRGILDADLLRRDRLTPGQLWAALNIELWFKIFIDRDPLWSARIGAAAGELLPAGAA